jgi:hypothetical protein
MRLPARTKGQMQFEDARTFHEALWATYQQGGRMAWPATEDTIASRKIYQQQMNYADFWHSRGYRMRSKLTKDRAFLELWLEVKPQPAWVQPTAWVA